MSPMETAKGTNWTFTFPRTHLEVRREGWRPHGRAHPGALPQPDALCSVLQRCPSSCSFTEGTGRAEGEWDTWLPGGKCR